MTLHTVRNAFVLLLLSATSLLIYAQGHTDAGLVIYSAGDVQLVRKDTNKALNRRDPVKTGDRIVTGKNSRARLRMIDGSILTLGDNTSIFINHYEYSKKDNSGSAQIELFKGAMRSITGAIGKTEKRDYIVKVPVGIIGIRGTDFWVGTVLSDALEVALISGKGVYVENTAGRVEIKTSGHGTTVKGIDVLPTKPKRWSKKKYNAALESVFIDNDDITNDY
jgi:hypothetical protein